MKSNTKSPSTRPVKVGGYSHAKLDAKRAKRQNEADARELQHLALTTEEKIHKAETRRGNSARELRRLHA